jgi:hypothetical protein
MKRLKRAVVEEMFAVFRTCGAGDAECVAYLTGPVDEPDLVDGLIHPTHSASQVGYDLDSAAIAELWQRLADERRTIKLQAHTHPSIAFHSARDDRLAIVGSVGFLSLVIPDFAQGDIGFEKAFLAERSEDGGWVKVGIDERLEVI